MPSTRTPPNIFNRTPDANGPSATRPSGCADTHKPDLIDRTIDIWQLRSARKLTREDGREIIENITGFFALLQEWEHKERTEPGLRETAVRASVKTHGRRRRCDALKGDRAAAAKTES